jgi:hypothetical protein
MWNVGTGNGDVAAIGRLTLFTRSRRGSEVGLGCAGRRVPENKWASVVEVWYWAQRWVLGVQGGAEGMCDVKRGGGGDG